MSARRRRDRWGALRRGEGLVDRPMKFVPAQLADREVQDVAERIEHDGHRNRRHRVGLGDDAADILNDQQVDPPLTQVSGRHVVCLRRDGYEGHAVAVLTTRAHETRQFVDARRAPGRPKVQDDRFSTKIGKTLRTPARRNRKIGRRCVIFHDRFGPRTACRNRREHKRAEHHEALRQARTDIPGNFETMSTQAIEALSAEKRRFPPSAAFAAQANAQPGIYEEAERDYVAYWANWARTLEWMTPFTKTLEWNEPFARWFSDGELNVSVNCLDRHVRAGLGDRVAFYYEGEPGDRWSITYAQLLDDVCRFANALRRLGIKKGDRVAVYMPMIPELPVALLACARIGAVHSAIFGGFSPDSIVDRVNDAECVALITADWGWRRGNKVPLKRNCDIAMEQTPSIKHCIVARRIGDEVFMHERRDHWWDELIANESTICEPERMNAEDVLFLLYTSGTTAKPKGIKHTTGGYLTHVAATHQLVFDIKPETDVYWCAADIGWVTGHSYIVYGPLANGATSVMWEGAPDYPDKGIWWEIVERYRVSILYCAPTAIRACIKWGAQWPNRHDLSSLRLLGSVGEPINPKAWLWYHKVIGSGRCPIVDTWWQTETGAIMISPLPGVTATKPGSATQPFPGVFAEVLDESTGEPVEEGQGLLVLTHPWPSMLRTLYREEERF